MARSRLLVIPILLLMAAGGCGGRRSAMRPVYLSPSTVGGYNGAVAPSRVPVVSAPAGSTTTVTVDPVVEPSAAFSESPAITGPQPVSPPAADRPPALAPAVPNAPADEPKLELTPAEDESSKVTPPKAASRRGGTGFRSVPVIPPGRLGNQDGADTGPPTRQLRVRQTSLSDRVRPFVSDPDDLFVPPKADRPWKYIVFHHSANASGGYDTIDRVHRDRLGWEGCGYHFIIGNGSETSDGLVEVSQRWLNQKHGVHCRDAKDPDVTEYGIGICLVGDLDKSPPTARQVAAAKALVDYLRNHYKIPADRVETHAEVAVRPTGCPGRLFPADTILGPAALTRR